MAYGRLDIFFPDGAFKTYALNDSTTSIGRAPGNSISIETTTLSRYHATIIHENGATLITDLDSVNGTFVDGVRLTGNQPYPLQGGEEITIGYLRLIYHFYDDTPTRPMTVPDEATTRIEQAEAAFTLEIDGPHQAISPGAHISAHVRVMNMGEATRRFRVTVEGVPKEWARVDRVELEIAPGKSGDAVISFRPRRRSDSTPGDYSVQVVVTPTDDPSLALSADILLTVLSYNGFGIAIDGDHIQTGDTFRVHLHNQGSGVLPIALMTRDLGDDELSVTLPTTPFVLAPGQRVSVNGTVKARRQRFFGDARAHMFDVIARSGDAAGFTIPLRVHVREKPPLPSWAAFAMGGIALAVGVVILIGLLVLLQPPPNPPTINGLQVAPSAVARGDALTISWQVADANLVRLLVNGEEMYAENDPTDMGSFEVDTTPFSGTVPVTLIAEAGDLRTEAAASFEVAAPLAITVFEVEPPRVVLYVAQTITVTWAAPGALTTRISGLENFTTAPTDTTYGSSATIALVGIPQNTLMLTLTASNEEATVQETVTVDAIAPQCSPAGDADVPLRSAPDEREQVIATIPAGTSVVVDAQDTTGQWLRAQISGGAHAWGERTAFVCADYFSVDDLSKAVIVPTAAPNATALAPLAAPTITTVPNATVTAPVGAVPADEVPTAAPPPTQMTG